MDNIIILTLLFFAIVATDLQTELPKTIVTIFAIFGFSVLVGITWEQILLKMLKKYRPELKIA